MKKIILAALILWSLVQLTSCKKVIGEGPVVTQDRNTGTFTGIEMGTPGDLYYTPGTQLSIQVIAQQNIADIIETYVAGNTLRVKVRNSVNIKSHERIVIKVTAPDINDIGVNGSGNVHIQNEYAPERIKLFVNGSGELTAAKIIGDHIETKISGSGRLNVVNGSTNTLDVGISGSGLADVAGLVAKEAKADISGSASIRVNASDLLDCRISGSGIIFYKGNPKINSKISGSGRVTSM